jgi:hypothetical protein
MRNYRFATYPRHNSLVGYAMVQIDLRSRLTPCLPKLVKEIVILGEVVLLSLPKQKKFGCKG